MKKILVILAALMMLVPAALAEDGGTGLAAGGWQVAENPEITEEVQALVDKALDGLVGMGYTPVAYLGSQVVAGTNHAVLCLGTPVVPNAVPSWKILYLYEDLKGEVILVNVEDFDFGAWYDYEAAANKQ